MRKINRNHPLSKLFNVAVGYGLEVTGIHDPYAVDYISYEILSNFVHIDDLYKIKDLCGKRLRDVGEFLFEADRCSHIGALSREIEIRRHIGDFILFWIGLFPEAVHTGILNREDRIAPVRNEDVMRYYIQEGKESYQFVSSLDGRFKLLSNNFEFYVVGLHNARAYLDTFKDPDYRRVVDRFLCRLNK